MPPKKDAGNANSKLLSGFEDKETKLLAAAFMSSIAPDKYDYDLMSALTGNTVGSLRKMWPPIKKKAIDAHSSFATFLGNTGANITAKLPVKAAPKAAGGRKRKAATETASEDEVGSAAEADTEDVNPEPSAEGKGGRKPSEESKSASAETAAKKKAPAKGRPAKKSKKGETKTEEDAAASRNELETIKEIADGEENEEDLKAC